MRAKVLDSIQPVFITENRDSQTVCLDGITDTFCWDFRKTGNPDPILCGQIRHVTNDILTAFDLRATLSTI